MKDRTRPMKWVEEFALQNPDVDAITKELTGRFSKPKTVQDQLRALRKHGIIAGIPDHAENDVVVDGGTSAVRAEKPFKPFPKGGTVKKKN